MKIMSIHKELKDWAEETINVYNPIAQTTGLGYYTQSVLNRETLNPDILILGINPGAAGGGIMTGEDLLQGNPCFKGKGDEEILFDLYKRYDPHKRKYGWDLMNKMHNILRIAGKQTLKDLDKFVLSNMVFLGTSKQGLIPLSFNKQIECATQTIKLINILTPKVVIILGDQSRDLFKMVAKDIEMKELVPNHHAHVSYCFYNECHIISIYHTAFYKFYNNSENIKIIGNIIGFALDNLTNRIDEQKLNSYLEERKNEECKIKTNEITLDLQDRTRKLKRIIKNNGAIQRTIYRGTVLFYDYFTTVEAGKYAGSEKNISIELMPEEDKKQYVVLVFTRQNNKEKTKGLINGIWPNENYNPWECDKSRHVHEVISFEESNEEIKNKIEKVLQEIKVYRDKEYPLNQ